MKRQQRENRELKRANVILRKASAYFALDTEIAGFALRIYPSGRKSFLITYRA